MDDDIKAPTGSPLAQLLAEDLSGLGLEELANRIALLTDEIARTTAMRESKKGLRSDAEALFK